MYVAHLDVVLIRAIALGSDCLRQKVSFLLYQAVIVMDHNPVAVYRKLGSITTH